MKQKKKTVMLISFTLGTLLFATTALAEVATKSGYEEVKDALKYTAESCSNKLPSYTMDISFVLKDNNEVIASWNHVSKYDIVKGASEVKATSLDYKGEKIEGYTYVDKSMTINHSSGEDTYFVSEYNQPNLQIAFANPFKEKTAGDLEKIADAVVGNLKDYVVVSVNPDGSKELSGSLSESQIPALVNAVTSFEFKNSFTAYHYARLGADINNVPKISSDIFVKGVKGNIIVDKNGLIQSILGTGTLSGKDEEGTEHSMTFELLGKLHDVNLTVVNKPDLTGKKVLKNASRNTAVNRPDLKKYTGQYKGDIVIEKDGSLIKIGERIVDIEKTDDMSITGRYHEEYKGGYDEYAADRKDFKFEANFEKEPYNTTINFTASSGKNIVGHVSVGMPAMKLYLSFEEQRKNIIFDGELSKVFN